MKLPNCPICMTSEHLVVDVFRPAEGKQDLSGTSEQKSFMKYHCAQDGYQGTYEPLLHLIRTD